jgi:hypothetical protein
MITFTLIPLFETYLKQLREEIGLYPTEESLWRSADGIHNSGGNLCLHLCGNLQHYVGAILGDTGYTRNREAEFSQKDIPRQQLLDEIDSTKNVVIDTMEQISKNQLLRPYPVKLSGEQVTTEHYLVELLAHFNYHLGQINYHRRLVG